MGGMWMRAGYARAWPWTASGVPLGAVLVQPGKAARWTTAHDLARATSTPPTAATLRCSAECTGTCGAGAQQQSALPSLEMQIPWWTSYVHDELDDRRRSLCSTHTGRPHARLCARGLIAVKRDRCGRSWCSVFLDSAVRAAVLRAGWSCSVQRAPLYSAVSCKGMRMDHGSKLYFSRVCAHVDVQL